VAPDKRVWERNERNDKQMIILRKSFLSWQTRRPAAGRTGRPLSASS